MPSLTDTQQQQTTLVSNIHGKSTPPPPSTTTIDPNNMDPINQALLVLEKKQRNLGKRKDKLESYQQEAKSGKELNKDQKDALAKHPEVLGQIDCVKELTEQFKKIQTETTKSQKRLAKQAAEEKRSFASQRLREYAQIRFLLDNRPTALKAEESKLLDDLSSVIIPSDNSSNSISRSVDVVLTIYQNGPASSTIKSLTGKTPQEVREIFDDLLKPVETQQQSTSSTTTTTTTIVPVPVPELELELEPEREPEPEPEPEVVPEQETVKELEENNDIQPSSRILNENPIQFDTRDQNITLEQIIENNSSFPIDLSEHIDDNHRDQSPDPQQYLPTFTVVNSNINEQSLQSMDSQQENNSVNPLHTHDDQQSGEQWQEQRGNANVNREGYYQNGTRNYNRGRPNTYNQHQRRGPRGGWYDNSYNGNQRSYYENNRGRGGSNSNYRGNRGGNYRGGNRPYNNNNYNNNNANEYHQPAQYQPNNEQYRQARSAPPNGQT